MNIYLLQSSPVGMETCPYSSRTATGAGLLLACMIGTLSYLFFLNRASFATQPALLVSLLLTAAVQGAAVDAHSWNDQTISLLSFNLVQEPIKKGTYSRAEWRFLGKTQSLPTQLPRCSGKDIER